MSSPKRHNGSYTTYNSIRLVKGGKAYFDLLHDLFKRATHSIYIRVYIWDDDATGTAIANQLIEAAERNVAVYVIADGYASQRLSRGFIKNLKSHGIRFRYFEPLLRSSHFYFGRRMHEKIVVVDGMHALVGGINFADRYNDIDGIPAWLDYAIYTEGEAARKLYQYCAASWNIGDHPQFLLPEPFQRKHTCSIKDSRNDWIKRKHEVWNTYFNLFNRSARQD